MSEVATEQRQRNTVDQSRMFSSRTLASQHERSRQSELRKKRSSAEERGEAGGGSSGGGYTETHTYRKFAGF